MEDYSHPVFRALHVRMLIGYADRAWFLCACMIGASIYLLLKTFIGGALFFAIFYGIGCVVGSVDPKVVLLVWNAQTMRAIYDAHKLR